VTAASGREEVTPIHLLLEKEKIMKKTWILMIIMVCVLITAMAFAQDDIKQYSSCKYCGMNRQQFAHSRIFIEYDDASAVGTCSIHCAAVDLAINIDKTPKAIQVGDYKSKALIDAEKAFWVIGGSKMGVMTKRAKWAFEKKEDAENFIKESGGENATFDIAMKAAYEDMYQDTKMIREKRKMMKMQHKK
jgi:nitrous oxide reductase accessory protein NosL